MSLDSILNILEKIYYLLHNIINTIFLLNTNCHSQQIAIAIIDLNQNNHPIRQLCHHQQNNDNEESLVYPLKPTNLAIICQYSIIEGKQMQENHKNETIRVLPSTLNQSAIKALALNLTQLVLCHEANCPTFQKPQEFPESKNRKHLRI